MMALLLGILLRSFIFTVLILSIFIFLRQRTGGYHTSHILTCSLLFITILYFDIFICKFTAIHNIILLVLIDITVVVFILIYAPCGPGTIDMTISQKENNRLKSVIIAVLLSITSILLFHFNPEYSYNISITMLIVILSMIPELKIK